MPDQPTPPASAKVVVAGAYGVGKTTLIRSLSEINVLTTRRAPGGGAATGIGMDFGRMSVDGPLSIHLFSAPTTDQLAEAFDVVAEGLIGVVILLDDSRTDSAPEAMEILHWFRDHTSVPYVIGVNKVARGGEERAVRRARHSLRVPEHVRVATVDVRDRDSSKRLLLELLYAAADVRETSPEVAAG